MKNFYALLVLVVFAVFFGIVGIYVGWERVAQGLTSRNWPITEGKITYSQIERTYTLRRTGTRKGEFRYYAKIQYEYTVNDVLYTGNRLAFADPPGGRDDEGEQEAREVLERYPILKQVQVYYDPDDPATAVLEPGISFGSITPFLAGFIMLPGGLFMLFIARRTRSKIVAATKE